MRIFFFRYSIKPLCSRLLQNINRYFMRFIETEMAPLPTRKIGYRQRLTRQPRQTFIVATVFCRLTWSPHCSMDYFPQPITLFHPLCVDRPNCVHLNIFQTFYIQITCQNLNNFDRIARLYFIEIYSAIVKCLITNFF